MKICIVTPDLIGPIRNGGIGTHATMLSRLLKGHDLTLLFTSEEEPGVNPNWKSQYTQQGMRVLCLEELKNCDPYAKWAPWEDWFFERSRRIFEYLDSQSFDLVHFQDWHANGYFAIRARRTGIGLQNTRLTVTMHSPNEWSRQGMKEWPKHVLGDMKLNLAERYCCEHADEVIAPSKHMFDWAADQGWKLPEHKTVLPYCYLPATAIASRSQTTDFGHLIFFGRLETRKGLGIFLDGLKLYLGRTEDHGIQRISFLGKAGQHRGQPAESLIKQLTEDCPNINFEVITDKDSEQALRFITDSGGIAIIPSLLDNCPFTVIECIERELAFLAAASGGIPEIAASECLFPASRQGVAEALEKRRRDYKTLKHPYQAVANNEKWLQLHKEWEAKAADIVPPEAQPKVSICIPYYNHPVYLPQLLSSLEALAYPDFEVIVCNDGSTQPEANRVFDQLNEKYKSRGWLFLKKENGGVGHTRNHAAAQATGEYIVFMDADNLAKPEMLKVMVNGIQVSGADCLTCYFQAFEGDDPPQSNEAIRYLYRPIGGGTAFSVLDNSFGDANFIVRRSVFETSGGFTTQRDASFEDWQLLFNLYYAGYDVDVIPQELFWYRHLETSFSRITHHFSNHERVLSSALADATPLTRELIMQFTIPLYYRYLELESRLGKETLQELKPGRTPWHKHVYRFYRRVIGDPKYRRKS